MTSAEPQDAPPPTDTLTPGTLFHGLEIVALLGRGGMGLVYRARQPQLNRFVALKILPQSLAKDPEFAQRFALEARALAALSHPNIVAVYDFGREGEQYFLVMEFVDGANLRALLKSKHLSPEEALQIVPVLCEALEYAHRAGVVHRDIKPENILMDKNGRVKIADFGLAKMLDKEQTMLQHHTQTNVGMGTPHYMAPEQFENAKAVDHRADIYSMGVLFYEMLTGELPLGRFEPPSQRVALDVRLDEIVLRALAKEPGKRYQSMAEVRQDLSRLSETPRRTPAKNAGLKSAAIVLTFVAAVAAIALFAYHPSPDRRSEGVNNAPAVAPVSPAPVAKPDLWSLVTLSEAELPAGWRITETGDSSASRAELLQAARDWAIEGQAEGLTGSRRWSLVGPNDRKMVVYAYQCRDTTSLDGCLQILHKRFFPLPHRILFDRENLFVLGVGDRNDGRAAPPVEQLEDVLRAKLGLPPAKRVDPTAVRPELLPEGWSEISGGKTDLASLLAALKGLPLPRTDDLRDGWAKSVGAGGEKGARAELISLRFFESADARQFVQAARTSEPPAGGALRVLHTYERVLVVFFNTVEPAAQASFDKLVGNLAHALGSGSDANELSVNAQPGTITSEALLVPLEFQGINGRELSRGGQWQVTVWAAKLSATLQLPAPTDFTHDGDKLQITLKLPAAGELKPLLDQMPTRMDLRIKLNPQAETTFDVQVAFAKK